MTSRYRPPRCSEVISRKEAKARGLKQYFTGQPCRHGHITARSVVNYKCMTCSNLAVLKWQAANPEKAAVSLKRWSTDGARLQNFRREFKAVLGTPIALSATKDNVSADMEAEDF